jgi:hypothetical protein
MSAYNARDRRLCRLRDCADLGLVRLPYKGSAGNRSAQSELIVERRAGPRQRSGGDVSGAVLVKNRVPGRMEAHPGSGFTCVCRVGHADRLCPTPLNDLRSCVPIRRARRLDCADLVRPKTPTRQGDLPKRRHNLEVGTIGVLLSGFDVSTTSLLWAWRRVVDSFSGAGVSDASTAIAIPSLRFLPMHARAGIPHEDMSTTSDSRNRNTLGTPIKRTPIEPMSPQRRIGATHMITRPSLGNANMRGYGSPTLVVRQRQPGGGLSEADGRGLQRCESETSIVLIGVAAAVELSGVTTPALAFSPRGSRSRHGTTPSPSLGWLPVRLARSYAGAER